MSEKREGGMDVMGQNEEGKEGKSDFNMLPLFGGEIDVVKRKRAIFKM